MSIILLKNPNIYEWEFYQNLMAEAYITENNWYPVFEKNGSEVIIPKKGRYKGKNLQVLGYLRVGEDTPIRFEINPLDSTISEIYRLEEGRLRKISTQELLELADRTPDINKCIVAKVMNSQPQKEQIILTTPITEISQTYGQKRFVNGQHSRTRGFTTGLFRR